MFRLNEKELTSLFGGVFKNVSPEFLSKLDSELEKRCSVSRMFNNEIEKTFSELNSKSELEKVEKKFPPTNIKDFDDKIEFVIVYPNAKVNNFSIVINDDNMLVVSYKNDVEKENVKYFLKEFNSDYNGFERKYTLPKYINNESKISASYKDGILRIEFTKNKPSEFKIEIK